MPRLSKSKYLAGLKCSKYLWIMVNSPGKIPEPNETGKYIIEQGNQVGELATKLYPNGIHIPTRPVEENIKKSKAALKKKKPLFEAGFKAGNLYARADILKPVGDEWDIIEVKASSKVKTHHKHDLAFQKYCLEKAGLKIRKCFLMHLNKEYVRKGKLDLKKLLEPEEVDVSKQSKIVPEQSKYMLDILSKKTCPTVNIHAGCNRQDPIKCPLKTGCWSYLPEGSVMELYNDKKKGFSLLSDGIGEMKEITEDYELTEYQDIQKKCAAKGKPYVNKTELTSFLKKIKYPIYYLDFETYATAVPLYDGLKQYQAIPFQFSLHVQKKNGELKHYSFLGTTGDPRKEFLVSLKKLLGDKGSIVVFFESFEKGKLDSLAKKFPSYKNWVEDVKNRIVDLILPFKSFFYYHPKQYGSCSIKAVLPALIGKSYSDLEISDGLSAGVEYVWTIHGLPWRKKATAKEISKVRENLLEYCGLDTEAMVWILEKLRKAV